jgi:hypothetical protein
MGMAHLYSSVFSPKNMGRFQNRPFPFLIVYVPASGTTKFSHYPPPPPSLLVVTTAPTHHLRYAGTRVGCDWSRQPRRMGPRARRCLGCRVRRPPEPLTSRRGPLCRSSPDHRVEHCQSHQPRHMGPRGRRFLGHRVTPWSGVSPSPTSRRPVPHRRPSAANWLPATDHLVAPYFPPEKVRDLKFDEETNLNELNEW